MLMRKVVVAGTTLRLILNEVIVPLAMKYPWRQK
jgi:hypothetical protein